MAFLVPIFENCCGPLATGTWTATISSSPARAFFFTPVMNSATDIKRAPLVAATSTSAPTATSGGTPSPAGEAVPRFPPRVPRFRI